MVRRDFRHSRNAWERNAIAHWLSDVLSDWPRISGEIGPLNVN